METIRSITKEDLPTLAKLVDDQDLCSRDDLCLEHSNLSLDEKGEITSFIILRHNSLIDYLGGEIPADVAVDKNDAGYEEGFEYHVREDVAEFKKEDHYELVYWYLRPGEDYSLTLRSAYLESSCFITTGLQIGVIWMPYGLN